MFSERKRANHCLLTFMDFFTKLPVVHDIPNQEASTRADVLMTGYSCHFRILK
jgi:hypothetical protein